MLGSERHFLGGIVTCDLCLGVKTAAYQSMSLCLPDPRTGFIEEIDSGIRLCDFLNPCSNTY